MFYIYLDTSFLSQLTKAARNTPQASSKIGKWINLLTLLRQEVNLGALLCPASQFPIQEAMLAGSLFKELSSLQHELSKGWYLKRWQDILVHQVANQALIYIGRQQDIDSDWSTFTKEPPPFIPPLITRQMKSNMARYAELAKLLRRQFGRKASYNEYYKEEKVALLGETFLNPNSDWPGMLISKAKVREEEIPTLFSFLNPKSVDRVPFINIFCSLWASIIRHEPTRKDKEGDLLDITPLACAIPYCRIVTTDTNMKNHIGRLRLDEKYGVSVYAPTDEDIDNLEKMISKLISR